MILDIRGKPIKTMVEGARSKLMVKFNEKRTGGESARWTITPTYTEMQEESKEWARNCKAMMDGPYLYQVNSGEKSYAVNLKNWTCGCRKWDMRGVPCNHVVCAIYKSKQQPEDFVHEFFKKPMYLEAYKPMIYPVPGPDLWTRTDTRDIDPPLCSTRRRAEIRLKEESVNLKCQNPRILQELEPSHAATVGSKGIDTQTVVIN